MVNGVSGDQFAPDAQMTRAEMAQLYVNLLGLTEKANISQYTDVPAGAWYADAIAKCVAAGILNGTSTSTLSPLEPVTREQMFVTFGRAMGVTPSADTDSTLSDLDDVSGWAEEMVNALLEAGYVTGTDSNELLPLNNINRASVVALLDQAVADYANQSGTVVEADNADGLILVAAGNVTITGATGDVVIVAGAANGTVTLDDATVAGTATLAAVGSRMILTGSTQVEALMVNAAAQDAQVSVGQDTSVNAVTTEAAGTDLSVAGTVENVTVAENASGAAVIVDKDATVGTVSTAAASTSLNVAGTVSSVTVSSTASGTAVNTEKGSKVESVITAGTGTTVSGSGTVSQVDAAEGASDTTVTTPGTTVENNSSESVTTDKGEVKPGETGTTSGGTTSGGSSGGSSGGVHTHSYTDGVCSCGAYDPAWAQVNSADTWNQAVTDGKNIILTANFTADSQLIINKPLAVNGNSKIITAGTWADANPTSSGDASLVSINEVTGAVVLKDLTLTGAQHIVSGPDGSTTTDYASGLNVYHSSSVTLTNVTLTGNAAAGMVVNSSTVNATGLHTSGNGWGGVNIDANVAAAAASLTFDAASTFGEQIAVYSDGGNVTVNAPEGWTSMSINGVTIWSKAFNGGSGTAEDPYEIATAEQLDTFRNSVNLGCSYAGSTIQLTTSIDLGGSEWTPIGSKEQQIYFQGTFDGNGQTISGLSITSGDYVGLFGAVKDATIKDLTVKGAVTGDDAAGIVARMESGLIQNCTSYVSVTSTANKKAGGIVCLTNSGGCTLENCSNYGTVSGMGTDDIHGGIVAYANRDTTITGCQNFGAVGNEDSRYAGGIAGYCTGADITISTCHNEAAIQGRSVIGGIAGIASNTSGSADITNCSNSGQVTGTSEAVAGGIMGSINSGTVSTCANTAAVHGKFSGGVVGEAAGSLAITNCSGGTASITSPAITITLNTGSATPVALGENACSGRILGVNGGGGPDVWTTLTIDDSNGDAFASVGTVGLIGPYTTWSNLEVVDGTLRGVPNSVNTAYITIQTPGSWEGRSPGTYVSTQYQSASWTVKAVNAATEEQLLAAAQTGNSVTITDNIIAEANVEFSDDAVLNLNGHTLTVSGGAGSIKAAEGKTLTVVGSGTVNGVLYASKNATLVVNAETDFMVNSSNRENGWAVYGAFGSTVAITGGTYTARYEGGVISTASAKSLSMKNATVNVDSNSMMDSIGISANASEVYLENVTVNAQYSRAVYLNNQYGSAVIRGGTFITNQVSQGWLPNPTIQYAGTLDISGAAITRVGHGILYKVNRPKPTEIVGLTQSNLIFTRVDGASSDYLDITFE